jgi:serine/threonine-protein kinase
MKLPDRYKPSGEEFSGGGMSEAFVCDDKHLERQVLVKRLQEGVDQSRLLDEIAALTSIRSKHVVQIFDVLKKDDGQVWGIVEEYLPGVDLNQVLPFADSHEFLKVAYAIACGLSDIHKQGRVHRDIKPGNMKFDGEGCLKIFDFGLSRTDDKAATVGIVGTKGYLAPELCAGEDEEVQFSQPIDVFAFGATALKMLRGKLPPDILALPPKLPSSSANFGSQPIKLAPPIVEILNRCLEVKAEDRPTMSEVRDLLASHLLHNQHRATLVSENAIHTLGIKNPTAEINGGALGSVKIKYDGYQFLVTEVSGTVTTNNLAIKVNQALTGSCVITLGDPSYKWNRKYITFDISHPEVVL